MWLTPVLPPPQLQRIVKVLGTPPPADVAHITNPAAIATIHSVGFRERKDFAAMFPKASPLAIDLLGQMLQFNPAKRVTAEEAIAHPFLKDYHEWEGVVEPTWAHRPIRFDFDSMRMGKQDLQARFVAELNKHYLPDTPATDDGVAPVPLSGAGASAGSRADWADGKAPDMRDVASTVAATIASTAASTPSDITGSGSASTAGRGGGGGGGGGGGSVSVSASSGDAASVSAAATVPPMGTVTMDAHGRPSRMVVVTNKKATPARVDIVSSPAPELSLSAQRDAARDAHMEAARTAAVRQRAAAAMDALRGGAVDASVPPRVASAAPAAPGADFASPPAGTRATFGGGAGAGAGAESAPESGAAPVPAPAPAPADPLAAMQAALSQQLSLQMESLLGRISDVLQPTQGRVERLERAVQRLADSVGAGDVLTEDAPPGAGPPAPPAPPAP